MRSPGSVRRWVERALRLTSLALLALMLWASLRPPRAASGARRADGATLASALERWTADPAADSLAIALDTVPAAAARDWLVALRRGGAVVRWRTGSIPASAVAVERPSEPGGGARVLFAAPAGRTVAVSDAAGVVDSVRTLREGGSLRVAALVPPARATAGRQAARAPEPDSLAARRVLVLGTAGWEAKFAIAALEERGWAVDARLRVAPAVEVSQGTSASLDTARYAAVVALDTAAAPWAVRIARFVGSGGGLVLAGTAGRVQGLRALAPATVGVRVRPAVESFAGDAPRRALALWPLESLTRDAVPLEGRDGRLAAAARRAGAGRVVQNGDDESWRWRMEGGDDGAEGHRAWWSAVVGSAAYRSAVRVRDDERGVEERGAGAPLAALVADLGPAASTLPEEPRAPGDSPTALRGWMLVALFATLLAEWTSRRLRGAP